ncbi:hypothetical protein [Bailinhaonella thermotolerans]|uniref:DNA polymerase III beta sliding clamp N-terminal domain-containing protein n=1 Tax=Bailinhaonella thermotolerans TaxID=1070861 RepID=A0A3A4ABY1_9ACTN|nr:hypothetical protein [Bailinhaonella thermotolerans]RJL24014.1 hypothetical protein D5H75_31810 [Bailinhaonella thermotolerans]
MRFLVQAEHLKDALNAARAVVPLNPEIAALGGARLHAGTRQVKVTGYDRTTSVTAVVAGASVRAAGTAIVPPRPLAAYLAGLPAGTPLDVQVTGGRLRVAAEHGHPYTFETIDAAYPDPPSPRGPLVDADLERLHLALSACRTSVSPEGTVQLVSTARSLVLHSTDTFRLTRAELPGAGLGERTCLVPLTALDLMAKIGATRAAADASLLKAASAQVAVTTRLAAPEWFPAVGNVLDAPPPHQVDVPRRAAAQALARLAALGEDATVTLRLESAVCTLAAAADTTGDGAETVELEHAAGTPFTCAFRLPFLAQAVAAHRAETLTLGYDADTRPLRLTSAEPFPLTTLVMPVRP